MTTRRRRPPGPPPPRGRSGRFGLLPPLAMLATSVEAPQLRPDAHVLPQGACEHPALGRALEAREGAARVGAPARLGPAGDENAVAGREPQQFALRRAPATAGAAPQRNAYEGSSSAGSAGMPAGTSSGSALSTSGATGGSSESAGASMTSAVASASSSCVSASCATASASASAG